MFPIISREKSFYRNVMILSWPGIVQNLLNNSLALLDSFMMGAMGERYLSGVSLANTVFFVSMLVLFGFQSGSSVLIAQYHGKGDQMTINRIIGISVGFSFSISMIIALLLLIFPKQIYNLTTNDIELAVIAAEYGRIAAFSIVFNAVTVIYLSAQRSMENPRLYMNVMGVSLVLKTLLNWVLIFGMLGAPALGIKGAALATLISRIFEFAITAVYAKLNKRFKLQFRALVNPGKAIFMDFLKYSLPVVISETMWGFGASLYTVIFGHLPNAVTALTSYAIVMNIERIVGAFHIGLGNATAIIVGKELGAGHKEGAFCAGTTLMALTTGVGMFWALILGALSYPFVIPYIFPLFGATEATFKTGAPFLIILIASLPLRALNMSVLVGILRGGGDVRYGMFIDLLSMYIVALPLSALAGLVFKASAQFVFLLMNTEELIKAILVIRRYGKKRWLHNITR
ncbi:MAG: MATE family efflux transporter [Peptococcaceae bacterium]|jgi:putative MATE family efflux protein|nr:MATE family efflux transporter [Peptococcaceae bacterium]